MNSWAGAGVVRLAIATVRPRRMNTNTPIPSRLILLSACLLGTGVAVPAARSAEESAQTPFEKECHANCLLLERDVNAKEAGWVERYFDTDACVERALAGIDAPARIVEDFRRSAPNVFFKTFGATLLAANSVQLLHLHKGSKDEQRALFRVVPRQGGVDYLDVVFEKTRRGNAEIVDADLYAQGQRVSQALRDQFLPLSRDPERGFFNGLPPADREYVDELPQLNRMATLNGGARFGEVLALYARLPGSVQKSKPALLQQLTAASQVDPRGLSASVDLWRATYPGEAGIELVVANLHHARRQYQPAAAALDRLDKALGGDAYLDVVRAQWEKNQGNLEQARTHARNAVAKNPKLHEGWELLISLGLTMRSYADVAQALNDWEQAGQVDVVRVAESDKLADFARSPEGRQWLAARDGRRGSDGAKSSTAAAVQVKHRLQGIFYSASNPSAIISGRTVYTGDRLVGGYRVERISPSSVTLQSPAGESVELALK